MEAFVTHPFAPVCGEGARLLILGSFPSVRSREEGFYYGHPRNRFWQVLARIYGEPVPASVPEKRPLRRSTRCSRRRGTAPMPQKAPLPHRMIRPLRRTA